MQVVRALSESCSWLTDRSGVRRLICIVT